MYFMSRIVLFSFVNLRFLKLLIFMDVCCRWGHTQSSWNHKDGLPSSLTLMLVKMAAMKAIQVGCDILIVILLMV